MSDDRITTRVAKHPKLVSGLLTVLLILSQAGMVAADWHPAGP
ncbi:DUF7503 family protein [Halocatena pleomorpha]|nr:hypothetical protein [Halocatena pleomorpha]